MRMLDFMTSDGGLILALIVFGLALAAFVFCVEIESKADEEEWLTEQRCRKCVYYEKCVKENTTHLECRRFRRIDEDLF